MPIAGLQDFATVTNAVTAGPIVLQMVNTGTYRTQQLDFSQALLNVTSFGCATFLKNAAAPTPIGAQLGDDHRAMLVNVKAALQKAAAELEADTDGIGPVISGLLLTLVQFALQWLSVVLA